MAYEPTIQADPIIFEKIMFIPVGKSLILKPILVNNIVSEAAFYMSNSKSENVRKYLPATFSKNLEEAQAKLTNFAMGIIQRTSLFYNIIPTNFQFPIGYINLNSPLAPTGLACWTVDFWLNEEFQNQGIVVRCLNQAMHYLQKNNVPNVKALVHSDNKRAINVIEKIGFIFVHQEPHGERRFLYTLKLN